MTCARYSVTTREKSISMTWRDSRPASWYRHPLGKVRRSQRRREVALFSKERFSRVDCRTDVNIFYFQQTAP